MKYDFEEKDNSLVLTPIEEAQNRSTYKTLSFQEMRFWFIPGGVYYLVMPRL